MKYLFLSIGICVFHWLGAQNQIKIDIDFDDKADQIYLKSIKGNSVKLVVRLSSLKNIELSTQEITNNHPEGFFSIQQEENIFRLDFHINYVERIYAYFEFDRSLQTPVLVKMERSVDGDNDVNGAGFSTLDVTNQQYKGQWSYYDYSDIDLELYRIRMPEISVNMSFPKIPLGEVNMQMFEDFRTLCLTQYQTQYKSIFPKGNNFVNGVLYVDLNGDYSADSIYLDTYSSRIIAGVYDAGRYIEISSDPTGFYADDEFEILELENSFLLRSTKDDQEVGFQYDKKKQEFVVGDFSRNNMINKDLDGDGVVDTVSVHVELDQSQYICQLSSQGFKKVKSGLFYMLEAKVDSTSEGLLLELFFERSGVNALFKYDPITQSMQLDNIDSWYIYDDVSQNLNMETGDYKASSHTDEGDHVIVKTTLHLPATFLQTFDEQFIELYYEKTSAIFKKNAFHKELKIGFGMSDDIFSVYAEDPIDLDNFSFLNCELILRLTDSLGQQQEFFVSNFDIDGSFSTLYDNTIHYNKNIGYYIEKSTSILPKGLAIGLYQVQCIVRHPEFIEDEISNILEYQVEK